MGQRGWVQRGKRSIPVLSEGEPGFFPDELSIGETKGRACLSDADFIVSLQAKKVGFNLALDIGPMNFVLSLEPDPES